MEIKEIGLPWTRDFLFRLYLVGNKQDKILKKIIFPWFFLCGMVYFYYMNFQDTLPTAEFPLFFRFFVSNHRIRPKNQSLITQLDLYKLDV